jgi:hypothetical protein
MDGVASGVGGTAERGSRSLDEVVTLVSNLKSIDHSSGVSEPGGVFIRVTVWCQLYLRHGARVYPVEGGPSSSVVGSFETQCDFVGGAVVRALWRVICS